MPLHHLRKLLKKRASKPEPAAVEPVPSRPKATRPPVARARAAAGEVWHPGGESAKPRARQPREDAPPRADASSPRVHAPLPAEAPPRVEAPPRAARKPKPAARPVAVKQPAADAPAWTQEQFVVAPVEGRTRFHDLGLPDEVMHGIADLGFEYCTPIQAAVLTPSAGAM